MSKATAFVRKGAYSDAPADRLTLTHDERHLRRRLLTPESGAQILVDLPKAVALETGDALVLEDGGLVVIAAADEDLYEITGRDRTHLSRIAWHIGNRHLPAEIGEDRILIRRDHVIGSMLTGLGATVTETIAPFSPERGAYHDHGSHHDHD
jgi:urease accessory protein